MSWLYPTQPPALQWSRTTPWTVSPTTPWSPGLRTRMPWASQSTQPPAWDTRRPAAPPPTAAVSWMNLSVDTPTPSRHLHEECSVWANPALHFRLSQVSYNRDFLCFKAVSVSYFIFILKVLCFCVFCMMLRLWYVWHDRYSFNDIYWVGTTLVESNEVFVN